MFGVRDDLIIPLDGIDTEKLLEFWRWLLPGSLRPWFATALGDLFLVGPDGAILRLEVGSGELQAVASSADEFPQAVADPDNNTVWFGEELVDELREEGKVLGPGECYSYITLPLLGGEYESDNFRIYDLITHFRVWGPIHEGLADVPDGGSVEFEEGTKE